MQESGSAESVAEGRISRGLRHARQAFDCVRDDRDVLRLITAGVILNLIFCAVTLTALLPGYLTDERRWLLICVLIAFPTTFVSTFINVAIAHTLSRRWDDEDAAIAEGIDAARERSFAILKWTLVAGTVGAVGWATERVGQVGLLERLASPALGAGWSVASFFVVPILAANDVGPSDAMRMSRTLARTQWSEQVAGRPAIGAASLVTLPGLLVFFCGIAVFRYSEADAVALISLGLLWTIPLMGYISAASGIFTLAVYRYAKWPANYSGPLPQADVSAPFGP